MLEKIQQLKFPLILDGGLSNELEAKGHDLSHTLWSTKLLATQPEAIKPVLGDKKLIVYPNTGMVYNSTTKTWHGTDSPEIFAELTKEWVELGADMVGGCCQVGPNHIKGVGECLGNIGLK